MESKPPQEEGKEEKAQGTGSDPVLLTIEECERQVELARVASLLSGLVLDLDHNFDGLNDGQIYELIRDALMDSKIHEVNKADHQL